MNTNENLTIYRHIQKIAELSCADINYLNDDEVIDAVTYGKLSMSQLSYICAIRYWYYAIVLRKFKKIKQVHSATADTTIETNMSFISDQGSEYAKERNANKDKFGINKYYINETKVRCFAKFMLAAKNIAKSPGTAKILYVGARTEGEILSMAKFGFNPRNITAIDLFSYSPLISLGDMHDMPFGDNSFDLCIMTHCIAYSEQPGIAFQEASRVIKPGGSFIFTVSTSGSNIGIEKSIDKKPRTGALNIKTFNEYLEIALATEGIEKKSSENLNIKGKDNLDFMKAGILYKAI